MRHILELLREQIDPSNLELPASWTRVAADTCGRSLIERGRDQTRRAG